MAQRLIIGISGASGVIYGIRMLEALAQDKAIETHLVMSAAAKATISQETDWKVSDVEKLASVLAFDIYCQSLKQNTTTIII